MLIEDRVNEMAAIIEQDKEKFKIELDKVRAIIDQIQQADSINRSTTDYSANTNQSAPNSSDWSGSVTSLRSVSSEASAAREVQHWKAMNHQPN